MLRRQTSEFGRLAVDSANKKVAGAKLGGKNLDTQQFKYGVQGERMHALRAFVCRALFWISSRFESYPPPTQPMLKVA